MGSCKTTACVRSVQGPGSGARHSVFPASFIYSFLRSTTHGTQKCGVGGGGPIWLLCEPLCEKPIGKGRRFARARQKKKKKCDLQNSRDGGPYAMVMIPSRLSACNSGNTEQPFSKDPGWVSGKRKVGSLETELEKRHGRSIVVACGSAMWPPPTKKKKRARDRPGEWECEGESLICGVR